MKRTQLNLDEKTYYQLVSYAREEKTSLSSAARNLISKQINKEKPTSTMGSLLKLVELGEKSQVKLPRDLSENHDYYLYGKGSPKFGTRKK
ncbi:hypothetical protein HYT74_02555 [Candidatus Daviesbacteria bacterium]|nr:hypothetical protein [Candidatus Daviesbacteria bacterium]MBI4036147.1 hypothetical protein [Candidatus Daviesbacteria bacterium]